MISIIFTVDCNHLFHSRICSSFFLELSMNKAASSPPLKKSSTKILISIIVISSLQVLFFSDSYVMIMIGCDISCPLFPLFPSFPFRSSFILIFFFHFFFFFFSFPNGFISLLSKCLVAVAPVSCTPPYCNHVQISTSKGPRFRQFLLFSFLFCFLFFSCEIAKPARQSNFFFRQTNERAFHPFKCAELLRAKGDGPSRE